MPVLTTSLYAVLLAIVGLTLAGLVGVVRGKKKTISLGDGGDPDLLAAMRRQMNFVEYVPVALLLLLLVELNGGPKALIHALGATLCAARIIHPFGIDAHKMNTLPRFVGTLGTFAVTLAAAAALLWQYLH